MFPPKSDLNLLIYLIISETGLCKSIQLSTKTKPFTSVNFFLLQIDNGCHFVTIQWQAICSKSYISELRIFRELHHRREMMIGHVVNENERNNVMRQYNGKLGPA